MAKSYQLSNNVIFCVNDDGSITKHAVIEESGSIRMVGQDAPATPAAPAASQKLSSSVKAAFVVIGLFVVVLAGMCYSSYKDYQQERIRLYQTRASLDDANASIRELSAELQLVKQEKNDIENEYANLRNKVGDAMPFIITDVEIANVYHDGDIETDYGSAIYSSNSMYLKPRIKYDGINSGTKEIKVKLYYPDGSLSSGTGSPYGYTYSQQEFFSSGSNNTMYLKGWGNSSKGHWRSGSYRLEIWYGNTCLKSKTFYIY